MITNLPAFNLKFNNTFRVDAECHEWVEFTDPSDLPVIFSSLGEKRWKAVGACSNILFTGYYPGALLHSRIMDMSMTPGKEGKMLLRAGSGIEMDKLIEQTCAAGMWGLENLSGIPGEVGAAAVQNVGAYGVEAKDVIVKVECYDSSTGKMVEFSNEDCAYGYRTSRFKTGKDAGRYVVTHVTFLLSSLPTPILGYGHLKSRLPDDTELTPMLLRDTIIRMRDEKLPDVNKIGSAGSYFKNPVLDKESFDDLVCRIKRHLGAGIEPPSFITNKGVKVPAAWLIDKSGLKGIALGKASTWPTQPLVIVNTSGDASATDIIALEQFIIETVKSRFGVTLYPEVEKV